MRRREFITLIGGTAASWPLGARAQQGSMPVVGFMQILSEAVAKPTTNGFLKGLAKSGFVEDKNVLIQYRYADGQISKLPALASDLVQRKVNVIAALGGSNAAIAAKAATATIPIVFAMGDADPVQAGVVSSLARPGANLTGISILGGELGAKRLDLLRDLVPAASTISILVNPQNKATFAELQQMTTAISARNQKAVIINSAPGDNIQDAFSALVRADADALIVTADPIFTERRKDILAFAAARKLPAIYQWNLFVLDGGLISYGADLADIYRQAGAYTARVLKGEKPGDLPVMQPTKFDLFVNLKTAKTLGIDVPPTLLALADKVIE
ncbi:MAG: ABC transporter substrate-binding protein [Xanthobacteraceae bacterium]